MFVRTGVALTLALGLFSGTAAALSYAAMSNIEVTEETDVWVRGRVLSADGPVTHKNDYGDTFRDITLQLNVTDATDDTPNGVIEVRSNTSFHYILRNTQEVFAALRRDGGQYSFKWQLGLYGWVPVDAQVNQVKTEFGPVGADVFWRWLQSIRYATDHAGQTSDADRAFWSKSLASPNPARVGIATQYFGVLATPHEDPLACFNAFVRLYEQALDGGSNGRANYELAALAITACHDAQRQGANETAGALIDFLHRDVLPLPNPEELGTQPFKMPGMRLHEAHGVFKAFAEVFHDVTDPEILARIPSVYEEPFDPGYEGFGLLPTAPSEVLDEWLWSIVINPGEHGVRRSSELPNVWRAMVARNHPKIEGYLKRTVASTPGSTDDAHNLSRAASDALMEWERANLSREDRVRRWAERLKEGDSLVLGNLARDITPEDRDVLETLLAVPADNWRQPFSDPNIWAATTIMERVPHEDFVPTLRVWAKESPDAGILNALAACGDADTVVESALAGLNAPWPTEDAGALFRDLMNRAGLVLAFGELGDPAQFANIRPFTETEKLKRLAKQYASLADDDRGKTPYPVWQMRDNALLAATQCGSPEAVPLLERAYRTEDIRGKATAAFALYALGNDTGNDLVAAYREHREPTKSPADDQWGVEVTVSNAYTFTIRQLKNPRLDALYLDRIENQFEYPADRDVIMDAAFFHRNRERALAVLRGLLDHDDRYAQDAIVDALRRHTGQSFGYDRDDPLVLRNRATEKWNHWIATELGEDAA